MSGILPQAKRSEVALHITGSGDPFGSKVYRELLTSLDGSEYPGLRIHLQTNGVMFTQSMWERLARIHANIGEVIVSLDAATEATYRVVRRGGHWGQLMRNLEFLAGLRREGRITLLRLDFVVQQRNFREMSVFVELAKRLRSVDLVVFSLVRDWGTWSLEEYEAQCVWNTKHPEFPAFLDVLRDPILEDPLVHLGNLQAYREHARRGDDAYAHAD